MTAPSSSVFNCWTSISCYRERLTSYCSSLTEFPMIYEWGVVILFFNNTFPGIGCNEVFEVAPPSVSDYGALKVTCSVLATVYEPPSPSSALELSNCLPNIAKCIFFNSLVLNRFSILGKLCNNIIDLNASSCFVSNESQCDSISNYSYVRVFKRKEHWTASRKARDLDKPKIYRFSCLSGVSYLTAFISVLCWDFICLSRHFTALTSWIRL